MAGVRITQLEPYGLPGRRYGSFAGRAPAGGHPVNILTQLTPYALHGRRYGDFSGRAATPHPVGLLTQLMPYAIPGQRYGDFSAKTFAGAKPFRYKPHFMPRRRR